MCRKAIRRKEIVKPIWPEKHFLCTYTNIPYVLKKIVQTLNIIT